MRKSKLDHLARVRGKNNKKNRNHQPRQDLCLEHSMSMSNEFSTLLRNSQVCQVLEWQHETVAMDKTTPVVFWCRPYFVLELRCVKPLRQKQAPHWFMK